jgi:hypothetical protein
MIPDSRINSAIEYGRFDHTVPQTLPSQFPKLLAPWNLTGFACGALAQGPGIERKFKRSR